MNRSEYFSSDYTKLGFNRSVFNMPFQHLTAFNTGDIVPLAAFPILPGDTWKTKVAYLLRLFTPMKQIFSNMYIDFYAFFVPNRLTWTHWANFLGQNDTTAWTETNTYTIPQNKVSIQMGPSGVGLTPGPFFPVDSLASYLGINPDTEYSGGSYPYVSADVSDLFRRAYLNIYNEWFRDENLIAPTLYSVGDTVEANPTYTYLSPLKKAAKFHDYFTVLLPEAMKGTPPIVGSDLPVVPLSTEVFKSGDKVAAYPSFREVDGSKDVGGKLGKAYLMSNTDGDSSYAASSLDVTKGFVPSNLWATMTITIEDIRKAAVATHVMEKLATSGTRYPEFLLGMWSVTSPNAELQIPELLGSQRFPIRIAEVVSNADTATANSGQYLGSTGALVKSGNAGALFNKAFTEYGLLFIECVVRIEQNYFQGLDRKFTDKSFFDFYLPALANIGAQPVEKKRLVAYCKDSNSQMAGNKVFGYSEAWAHLRHIPYLTTSIMRPDVPGGLSSWSASDIYSDPTVANPTYAEPSLNQAFIEQSAAGLDRCIAVPSATRNAFQWFGDFKFDNEVTRIIEPHAMPGVGRI